MLKSILNIVTDKGKERAKHLFRKYLSNSKLDQEEAAALYHLYPQYLLTKKMLFHFVRTIYQFQDLIQKYNLNDEMIDKNHENLVLNGYMSDNPDYEESES